MCLLTRNLDLDECSHSGSCHQSQNLFHTIISPEKPRHGQPLLYTAGAMAIIRPRISTLTAHQDTLCVCMNITP